MEVSFKSALFFIATPLAVGHVQGSFAEGLQEAMTITGMPREMTDREMTPARASVKGLWMSSMSPGIGLVLWHQVREEQVALNVLCVSLDVLRPWVHVWKAFGTELLMINT